MNAVVPFASREEGEHSCWFGGLALQFPQSKHWGRSSATDTIRLPQPKPRTIGLPLIVPPIRSREVARA